MSKRISEHPDIGLSGRCYAVEEIEARAIHPRMGDLKLYDAPDAAGRRAMAGRHANYGFSGAVRASVFDGQGWRKIRLIALLGDAVRFPAQKDKNSAYARVRRLVPDHKDRVLRWDGQRYVPSETTA